MANGHSWSSIQKYSLAEIGIFFKTVIKQEREDKVERLSHLWMGANLEYKGLQDIVKEMKTGGFKKEPTVAEVGSEWRRLASFMAGRK